MSKLAASTLPKPARTFVPTKECHRFGKFCAACQREGYIGLLSRPVRCRERCVCPHLHAVAVDRMARSLRSRRLYSD